MLRGPLGAPYKVAHWELSSVKRQRRVGVKEREKERQRDKKVLHEAYNKLREKENEKIYFIISLKEG